MALLDDVAKKMKKISQVASEKPRKIIGTVGERAKSNTPVQTRSSSTTKSVSGGIGGSNKPKGLQRRTWYKGTQPTRTETTAQVYREIEKDPSRREEWENLYNAEISNPNSPIYERYAQATSENMAAFGLTEINDNIVRDYLEPILNNAVHTKAGAVSSAQKNGTDAVMANAASYLIGEYEETKGLLGEEDSIRKRMQYMIDKGYTDDEIRADINYRLENTNEYAGLSSALKKSKEGAIVRTTAPIQMLTSYGMDGMLWSLRNPDQSNGNYELDAVRRELGQGKSYTDTDENIARRTMGSNTWSPYTNGTTMDDAAITLGVNGKEGFSPDYWDKNRSRILSTGTEAEKKAFEASWKAEEFTRKAEEEAARFKEAFEKGIASGMRPEEFFTSDFFESGEFNSLKKLYDGWYSGNPAEVTRAIDFDIADYMKQAQASYDKRMGVYTTDEYEQNLSNATGGSYQPDDSKTEVHNYKDWNEGILLKDFSPSATKKEQQSFRISAHMPVFTDVSVQTFNAIQNGKGGAKQMHEAQLKATNDYANDHYYTAMDAINGIGTVYSEMDDATINAIREYFPGKYEAGELPTREDVDALLASMPDVNTTQMQADFQNVASDFAYGDVKMEDAMPGAQQFVEKYMPGWDGEFLPTLDDVQAAMQGAGQEKAAVQSMWEGIADEVDQAGVRYAERQQAAADAEKELANIYGMYAEMYGEGSKQYNSAIATFEVNYQFKSGVPKEWQAFDHYQQRSMQDGYDPAMSADLLSTMRGENAKEMKWVSDYLENAKLAGTDEDIIANMESYLADLQKQNRLLDAHKLQQNADYADKVLEFDAAYTASENAVLDTSSPAGMINSIIANPGVGTAYMRTQIGMQGSQQNFDFLTDYEENASVMTDEERNNYKYIAVTQGVEAAAQYFLDLQDNLTVRAYQQQQEDVREFAGENVVNAGAATVGSVLLTPFEAMEGIDTLVRGLFGEDINPYEHKAGMAKSASREGTKDLAREAWGEESAAYKVFEVVYDASTSGADSMLAGHMGGSTVGALLMGLGGFENAVNDARMRGASNEDAILYGAVSALIEAGTEKLDIDRMFKAFDAGAEGTKSFLKTIAQGFGAEGLEEALSSIGTTIADDAIMQAMSNRDLAIQEYMALGLTEDEAKAQAGRDILTDVLYSGLVGGVSGTITSGIEYGAGKIVGKDQQVNTEQNESEQPTEENTTEEAEQKGEPAAEAAENQAPAEQPVTEQVGTPQERTVAALATANQNGVGERQQAATIAGVFQSWGVRAEAGISAAKNIVSNGWGMAMQRMAGAAQDAPRLMEALSVAANSATSQCAAVMNETFTNAKEQVGKLMEALTADQQNADVQSEYDASVTQSMEADVTASLEAEAEKSNADLKAAKKGVEDAQTNVNAARTEYLEAQKTLEQARVSMEATRERFLQNPGDDTLRQQYSEKIKNLKKAGETAHANAVALNSLMTIFGKANNHLKSVTDQIANTCREQAKVIVAERNAEYAKQQAEDAAVQAQEQQKAEQENVDTASFIQPSPEHTPEQKAEIKSYHNATDIKMLEAAKLYKENPSAKNTRVFLSEAGDREKADIQKILGLDVDGYTHTADRNFFTHVSKRHGENGEADHTMKSLNDVARVGWVLENYDNVEQILNEDGSPRRSDAYLDRERNHMPLLRYTKKLNGTIYVVEAAGDNAYKRLWLVSAYMKKNNSVNTSQSTTVTQTPHAGDQPLGNVQNANASPVINSIPQSAGDVNGGPSQPKTGVSQFAAKTGQNTTVLSDEVKKQLRESPYYQKTNQKGNMDRAIALVESEGYETRRNKLLDGTTNLYSPEGQVEAYALAKIAKEMGDTVGESSIAFKVKESGTLLGQSLAMRRMYVEMTPEGKQMYVQRVIDQINARYERDGKDTRVSAPDWLAERLEQAAGDDAQTEAVLNEAYLAIADQMPPDWKTKINGWRYLSMLANPRTHVRNLLGNALFAPAVSVKNQIGALMEVVSGSTERTKALGKVDRKYKDYAKTQLDGVKDILSGGGKQNPMDVIQQNRKTFDSKLLEWLSDKNSEWLEKGDAFFLNRHFVNSLAGYLQANKADLNNLPDAMLHQALDYAINEAQKATYRDASELADRISKFTRGGKTLGTKVAGVLVEGALPFKKTPINVMRRGIEYSPVGLVDTMIRGRRNLKKGKITQAEFFDSVASGLTGTALSMVGAWMYSLGAIELDLDEPKDELKKLQGKQEYSLNLKLFGEDISFTIDWLSPSAMPLFTGAAIADLYADEDKEVNLSGLWDTMLNLTEPMFNLSMLDGVNKLLSAASNSENGVMDVAMQAAEGYATQFVPTVLGAFARLLDPVRRTTYTDKNSGVPSTLQYLWDSTINKIPGMSTAGQPYLNAWGEEDVTDNLLLRAAENFISPGYLNEVDTDGVEAALMELFDAKSDTGILPKAPQKYFTVDGERRDLTGEEYALLTKERGTMAKKLHEELFSDPRFYEASAEYQVKALKNVWEYATQLAKHHIDENYTPDTWIRNATDPKEAILQKMSENIKSDQKESFKAGVYDAVEAGDFENAETCIAGWKSMGGTDKSLKTYLTSKYQLKYRDLYAAGDLDGLEEIRQNLYALDIGFTGADFMTWLSGE